MSRAILLVDHGSQHAPANQLLDRIAGAVRARLPGAIVEVAHMELAEPSLAAALARCAARGVGEVVVCPYFLSPGRHTSRDIPVLVEQARAAHPALRVRVAAPLGFDERLVDVLLARADAAI
ncbi:MAG TPA: CbiX/SirB N-terminal domain-containing protein [Myxococcota bacterium]|nr:CbiX/SirB N-terminal domain-containing protein [Myxococcota bacterium]